MKTKIQKLDLVILMSTIIVSVAIIIINIVYSEINFEILIFIGVSNILITSSIIALEIVNFIFKDIEVK